MKVLLVEDNPGDVNLIRLALGAAAKDLVFEHVDRLALARDRVAQGELDVVLLDLTLPDSAGVDTVRRLCAAAPTVPVVVLTGVEDEALGIEALQVGAQDYLVKGQVSGPLLVRAIRYARERSEHKAQRERATRAAATLEAARAAAEQGRRRSSFLADASRVLAASLDEDTTLEAVARLAVPYLADICLLGVMDRDDKLRRVVAVHAEAVPAPVARALEQIPMHVEAASAAARAMRTGVSEVGGDAIEAFLRGDAASGATGVAAADRDLVADALRGSSCMIVPLVGRQSVRGVLALARMADGRRHAAPDVGLAEDLAYRAALAVDNARLYRVAQEAIRARDDFITIACHELKTPLTSLILQTQSLAHTIRVAPGALPVERAAARLGIIERQIHRLTRLIEELLDVSRITTGKLRLDLEDVDLSAIVGDVVERLDEDARRAGCRIDVHADASIVGRWDRLRLEQVLTNLLINAMKFGGGKPVEVTADRTVGTARLVVRDHGIGVGREDRARIFGRFERAVGARAFGGLGLGLYITHEIVGQHGGTIVVDSPPGEGTSFAVELPLAPRVENRAAAP